MGSLYLGGPTIQEVDGKMMMRLSIYGVAVISGSLYSRFYGMTRPKKHFKNEQRSRDAAAKKRANTSGVGKINN